MTSRIPGFSWRPVRNFTDTRIVPIGLVLHVQQGNGSLFGYFDNRVSGVSAHLWAGKDGRQEQYVACDQKAWHAVEANSTYIGIETEGFATQALNEKQLDTIAAAFAFGVKTWGWPLAVVDTPGEGGLITHAAGGTAWGGHECPGRIRSGQRAEIIRRATAIVNGEDDDMTPEQMQTILDKGTGEGQTGWAGTSKATLAAAQEAVNAGNRVGAQVAGVVGRLEGIDSQLAAIRSSLGGTHTGPITVDDILRTLPLITDRGGLVQILRTVTDRLVEF